MRGEQKENRDLIWVCAAHTHTQRNSFGTPIITKPWNHYIRIETLFFWIQEMIRRYFTRIRSDLYTYSILSRIASYGYSEGERKCKLRVSCWIIGCTWKSKGDFGVIPIKIIYNWRSPSTCLCRSVDHNLNTGNTYVSNLINNWTIPCSLELPDVPFLY